ncbi:MAG: ISNCY family transposase [Sphaerospermopsis sp. SIO1G2]|nr:ISNCY family transposase [Sphaerospermopsis sp. SIO1G2]
MVKRFPLKRFFQETQKKWSQLPDNRKASPNKKYDLSDAVNSAMSVFVMQSPSFLDHNQRMNGKQNGKNNLQTLFDVKHVPSDNQIRNLIDPISSDHFASQYHWVWQKLREYGVLDQYQSPLRTLSIALDGMTYHSSRKIHCPNCSTRKDRNGDLHYYHSALLPVVVKPNCPHVIPLFPEMITPQDGHEKQDCERNAARRWISKQRDWFSPKSVTYLGDDLYAYHDLCQQISGQGQYFIFVCKPESHIGLYRWLDVLTVETISERVWTGSRGELHHYSWVNDIPIREGDSIRGSWCEWKITDETTGAVIYHNSWFTNHWLHVYNVKAVCQEGRSRWKVENEGINVSAQIFGEAGKA